MGRGVDADERDQALEFIPAGDDSANPGDASEQWTAFESFRDEAESDRRGMLVWVYRIPTDGQGVPLTGGQTSLLFTAPIDTFPSLPMIFERVKKEYMPRGFGRALIRIQVRREKVRGVLWQAVFPIEKGANDDAPESPTGAKPSGDIATIAELFNRTLQASMEQNRQLIAQILAARNVAPPVDPMAQSREIITMVTGLAGVLAKPGGASPIASISDQIAGTRDLLKLARELGGLGGDDGGGGDEEPEGALGVMKALSPWAGVFEKLLSGMQNVPALPAPQPQARPQLARPQPRREPPAQPMTPEQIAAAAAKAGIPPGAPVQPGKTFTVDPTATSQPTKEQAMLAKIVELTNDLLLLESGGGDPVGIGKSLAAMVTPDIEDRLLNLLDSPDWFTQLAAFNPKVRGHEEFFGKVRDAILSEYIIEGDDAAETDGAEIAGGAPSA